MLLTAEIPPRGVITGALPTRAATYPPLDPVLRIQSSCILVALRGHDRSSRLRRQPPSCPLLLSMDAINAPTFSQLPNFTKMCMYLHSCVQSDSNSRKHL